MAAFVLPTSLPRATPILPPTQLPLLQRQRPIACTPAPGTLREAYKSAKAAYKSAKRAVIPVSPTQLSELETTYRAAKAQYKELKRAKKGQTELLPEIPPKRSFASRYPATPIYDAPTSKPGLSSTPSSPASSTDDVNQVAVCGGKSCKRLGADAVAAMMRLSPPEGKCMKKCGGVGPTISIDGVPRKVNFRKAVADAMHVAAEQYHNN